MIAHTLDFENPSTKVLARLGYVAEEQLRDATGTRLWRWRLSRG